MRPGLKGTSRATDPRLVGGGDDNPARRTALRRTTLRRTARRLVRALPSASSTVLGVAVGLALPLLAPALGIPPEHLGVRFRLASLTAGVLVGVGCRICIGIQVRRYVSRLSESLHHVTTLIAADHRGEPWPPGALSRLCLPEKGPLDGQAPRAINGLIRALEIEHAFRTIIDGSGDLVVVLDETRMTFVSQSVAGRLGRSTAEMRDRALADFVHPADLERFGELCAAAGDPATGTEDGAGTATVRPRVRLLAADGSWRVLEWTSFPQAGGLLGQLVLTGRDLTEQVLIERELVHQATHDILTGLPNRKALLGLAAEVVSSATSQHPAAVIMIDLDRFKDVNDSLGHAVGDQLLAQVGPRLRDTLRPSDAIARLGGDEFAVLLPAVDEDGATAIAERLAAQLEDPFGIDGMDLHVEASLGIAVSHRAGRDEGATVETLLREADIAMYRAKEYGLGIATFDPHRDAGQNRSRLELSAELRRAIAEQQLAVFYQPVVDILEGRLAGVEALVRWHHPERGLVSPADFLPLAEQTGLIVPLSKYVLDCALAQAAEWCRSSWALQVAVNISPRWLRHSDLVETVEAMLAEHGVAPQLLRLEITESAVLADPEDTLPLLVRLRDMGVGLSLDDFGTGYSSMTHLRQLPVDELKVDRAFVQAMTTNPQDAVIVRAAIGLGHDLGMAVVAEGIEDVETLTEVVASGCSLAQGYYFSPPVPADQLATWARQRFGTAPAPVRTPQVPSAGGPRVPFLPG